MIRRLAPASALLLAIAAGAAVLVDSPEARACGGCFHQPTDVNTSLVTQHRMVFSVSTTQTVLWDQIQYAGSPRDFAWVLPVKPGAVVQLSQDAWLAALEANTQTVIVGPSTSCGGAPVEDVGGSGAGGCGYVGGASAESAAGGGAFDDAGTGGGGNGPPPVQVVMQSVVGPYQSVTVRSSMGEALGTWLRANGYDVPLATQPVIDAFAAQGFDFLALKLAPGEGINAMQPVRVITPGADATLPLRMVAAGTGAQVGIELWVISEGRYHPQNFPDVSVDFSKLAWDPMLQRSNYTELAQAALASGDGTGWLTTYSGPVDLFGSGFGGGSGGAPPNPGLLTAYQQNCVTTPPQTVCPPAPDAGGGGGGDAGDAASDASSDAGSADAATADAGDDGGGGCQQIPGQACDDYDVAMQGLNAGSIWVTRLHADLPQAALASDLIIEANPQQTDVQNVHTATQYTVANYNPCPGNASGSSSRPAAGSTGGCACRTGEGDPRSRYQDVLSLVLGGALAAFAARRRRRSSRR